MDRITEGIRTTHLRDEPEVPDQLIFNLQGNSILDLGALYNIPRYLFRIVSPLSDGRTDSAWVRSQAACQNTRSSREDVFSAWNNNRQIKIASTLNLHLRWWPKGDLEDNFVSWTSSLLFAIQYIYYRHQDLRDASSLDYIDLYVIDTTQFPLGTFLRDLDLIKAFLPFDTPQEKNLKDLLTLREKPNFYFGEYLSQGSLKIEGKCQRISAATLFENDALYRLQPEFGAISNRPPGEKAVWVQEVNRIRDALYQQQGRLSMQEMSNRLEAVGELSGHFPPSWQLPLAIYFAGLISHDSVTEDEEIGSDNVFFAYFRSSSFYGEHKQFSPRKLRVVAPESMPELQRVEQLVREIYKDSRLRVALGRLQRAETAIQKIRITSPFSILEDSLSVSDSNTVLARAGDDVLSKVDNIRQLCDQLVQELKPNNEQSA